jgi:hypothetical protein
MSPQQRPIVPQKHRSITMMLCLDQQDRARLQIAQKHPTLNFGLHNIVIDLIAQIRVGPEHLDLQVSTHKGYQPIDVCIIHPEAAERKYFP